jgi:hypothetical protein
VADPLIALATQDFAAYLDLSRHLRSKGIAFRSLTPGAEVPDEVDVVITTREERHEVAHDQVVTYSTPKATVEESIRVARGLEEVDRVVVGVDPGPRPGLAVLADGHVLASRQTSDPERVVDDVAAVARRHADARVIVRVGHGAGTRRDRIVNGLLEAGFVVELVDESETSPPRRRLSGERDKVAARVIATTAGERVTSQRSIDVPPGEISDIQRRSRKASEGEVTISRALAGKVAEGAITLAEALRRQSA